MILLKFFRRYRKNSRTTLDDLDVQVTALEADLTALRDQRSVLLAAQTAEAKAKADSEKKAREAELAAAQKAAEEASKRVLELKAQLGQ